MAEIKITVDNFEEEVLKSDKPVLVDFWAEWCGPCQMIAPTIAQMAEKYQDKIKVGKANVDQEMELAYKYKVASIPTMILFMDGEVLDKMVGFSTMEELEKWLSDKGII